MVGIAILKIGGLASDALFIALVLTLLVCIYPLTGIIALIAGTVFIPFNSSLPLTNIGSINIPDLILYFSLFLIIIKATVFRHIKIITTPIDLPIAIFLLVGTSSLLLGTILDRHKFFLAMHEYRVIPYYLLSLIIPNIVSNKKELKILVYVPLLLGTLAAFQVVFQGFIRPATLNDDPMEVFYRYSGIGGGWLLMFWTLVVLISFLFIKKVRLLFIFLGIIILSALILSFSRHWWISFVFQSQLPIQRW